MLREKDHAKLGAKKGVLHVSHPSSGIGGSDQQLAHFPVEGR